MARDEQCRAGNLAASGGIVEEAVRTLEALRVDADPLRVVRRHEDLRSSGKVQ